MEVLAIILSVFQFAGDGIAYWLDRPASNLTVLLCAFLLYEYIRFKFNRLSHFILDVRYPRTSQ
jgi:hypothetical protein